MALKDLTSLVKESLVQKEVEEQVEVENDIINEDVESVDLGALVDEFFAEKSIIDAHKKRVDALNARIKEVMTYRKLDSFETADNIATKTITEKSSLDEELMLVKLKSMNAEDLIATKEVPDIDLIEDRIYHNEFDAKNLADCMKTSEIIKLTVKAKKKKGGKK